MAAPKKTLGSIIAAEQGKDRPDHYPAPEAAASEPKSKESPRSKKRSKPTSAKPVTGAAGEKRRMISADLSETQYRGLRDMADDLGCSKVEVIRAFIQLAENNPELLDEVRSQLGTHEVHRPRGFAYLAARAERHT